ncbi:EthD family reductase [Paracoccus aminophilus]|uniref:EthD domain-containing protein n=1 Tax=Paracoccus aminophilus JCM 7686 TaxID=1367847 RepID=S5YUN6_PARAH|nr:EthD family reductase [Paracoccus aminophilus]AGT08941.1 hypothetical protein JCM7686_1840 [Paracoccus aminophilus JCM 7686]
MFKAIILLKRRDDLPEAQFRDWWLSGHAPLVRQLPGLRKAVFNLLHEAPYDGVSELWFDSQADFEAAYATEAGKAVAADTLAHVSARIRMLAEEHVIVGA